MLVSVIVTTYNAADTVARLLDSVLAQEGRGRDYGLEVIVVDDCSADGTAEIVRAYPDVHLVVNAVNSGGPNRGRNVGLSRCRGDAIAIADHDDEWLPGRLRAQLPVLAQAPVVTCGYTVVDEGTGREVARVRGGGRGEVSRFRENETHRARLRRDPGGQTTYLGTVLYASSLRDVRFEETYGAVDFDWVARLFEGRASAEVSAPLYRRYVDGANLSLDRGYRLRDYAHTRAYLEAAAARHPADAAAGLRRLEGSMARYYYLVGDMPAARRHLRSSDAPR